MMSEPVVIGTRGSPLALWQADWVRAELEKIHPDLQVEIRKIVTSGDMFVQGPLSLLGGKGLFVKEIETALQRGEIDLAVHSMKDVPAEFAPGLGIGAVPPRQDPRDVFLSRNRVPIAEMPIGSRIGTSSLRRQSQLLHHFPGLRIVALRGNVDTRIRKLREGQELDGIVMAAAGLKRLSLEGQIDQFLETDFILPAIGQGALGIEIRLEDSRIRKLVVSLNDSNTAREIEAERALLKTVQGGCQVPVAAFARLQQGEIVLDGLVASLDGRRMVRDRVSADPEQAAALGVQLGEKLLAAGGREILQEIFAQGAGRGS
ncbi:MAG TPA: hydroxymethylbilane synthase [bacterium]|nr:hydroxymethylbilane synthase [bacterium]